MIKFFAGLTACFVVLCAGYAIASRNSSGTYSIPNTFTSGSVISSSAVNANFSDIGTELTSSLDRAGRGAMTAQLQLASGTVTTPGLGFSSDTGSGLYRIGSNDIGFAINGVKKLELTATAFTVVPNLALTGFVSGNFGLGAAATYPIDVTTIVGATHARFGDKLALIGSQPNIGFNLTHDGANFKYMTNNIAGAFGLDTTNGFIIYTAPAGTAGNSATVTERLRVNSSGTKISTGVGADGSGFKHQSVAGCATGAAVGSSCDTVLTWTTQFADTSYQAVCSCSTVTTGKPYIGAVVTTATQVTVTSIASTAVAAQCTNVVCFGVHD